MLFYFKDKTVHKVGNDITLGEKGYSSSYNASKASYNSAVSTLNSYADAYVGAMATGGRCLGSNPVPGQRDAIESTVGTYSNSYSYFSSYNYQCKRADTEYQSDYNAMNSLKIMSIGKKLLACFSRNVLIFY